MIVDEVIVRKKVAEADLREEADRLLANAVVKKAVENEVKIMILSPNLINCLCFIQRVRRAEVKQKLEFLAKLEIVEKVKVCTQCSINNIIIVLLFICTHRTRGTIQVVFHKSTPTIFRSGLLVAYPKSSILTRRDSMSPKTRKQTSRA